MNLRELPATKIGHVIGMLTLQEGLRTDPEVIPLSAWVEEATSFLEDTKFFIEQAASSWNDAVALGQLPDDSDASEKENEAMTTYRRYRRAAAVFFLASWNKLAQTVNQMIGAISDPYKVDIGWLRDVKVQRLIADYSQRLSVTLEAQLDKQWFQFAINYRNAIIHRHDPDTNLFAYMDQDHFVFGFDNDTLPELDVFEQAYNDTLLVWDQVLSVIEERD